IVRPYGSTFLQFADYMRGAVRLSALMGLPVCWVYTHDSVGLGEDGPTHQPVEHLAALRAIPGLTVIRPGDANETAAAWRTVLEDLEGPAVFALSRQDLPVQDAVDPDGVAKGAYVLRDADDPGAVIVGTGSELWVALAAADLLAGEGIDARVVSMPSWELFEAQDDAYRDDVLLPGVPSVSVEAGISMGLGALGGSQREHRALRRQRAGPGGAREARDHAGAHGGGGAGAAGAGVGRKDVRRRQLQLRASWSLQLQTFHSRHTRPRVAAATAVDIPTR
ncbi:MAG: transketolase, partial [Solirubrobacterales bacterium]|nr:transketolase [Solirubrobacterales bacterium]